MDIYIKPNKKINITERKSVYVSDIAEVFAPENMTKRIKNIKLLEIKDNEQKNYLIGIIDIIRAIDTAMPGHTINNVGEQDTVVEYLPKKKKNNVLWRYVKIAFVTIVLFGGASTAIMSFHSDAQLATVFENYYYMFFNERVENPIIIDLPYSVGLAVGIIVFFNHFSGKKLTTDPTPIEVELSTYEKDVVDNIIDTLNVEKTKGAGNDNRNN